jgi:hypothetical protein
MSFYVLNNHLFDDDDFAISEKIPPINLAPADRCEVCNSPISLKKWLPPCNVRVTKKRLGDFIVGDVHPFLVSQRFKDLYESGGYRGIDSFSPVRLYFRRQPLDTAYYYPHIPYNYNKIDLERCGITVADPSSICLRCQHGGNKGLSNMTGVFWEDEAGIKEDVFENHSAGQYSFSQRLKDAMEAAGITNTVFVPAAEFVPSPILALRPKQG